MDHIVHLCFKKIARIKSCNFRCVPGMALIQLEINQPQVFTAKCNEPQVVVSDGKDGGSGVVILLSVRTET